MLLLDSHRPGDTQIGALGVTHNWEIDRKIVESVRMPIIIAGGLGPDNAVDAALRMVQPAGVDSKTKTDKDDESHTKDLQKVRRSFRELRLYKELVSCYRMRRMVLLAFEPRTVYLTSHTFAHRRQITADANAAFL